MALSGALKKLLVCVVIVTKAAETADPAIENGFPPLWGDIPGDLGAFRQENNHAVIDPWKYRDRMGMLKILLSSTHKYYIGMGLTESDNTLWSLPIVSEWVYKTGRLADPSKITTCGLKSGDRYCISPYSWGACISYYFTTLPFLVAAEAGFFENWTDETEILPPNAFPNDFCNSYESCSSSFPSAMGKWKLYFKKLMETTPEMDVLLTLDQLDLCFWEAHEVSIETALPIFKNRLMFLSEPEADFEDGLGRGVHFVGATGFGTNYPNMKQFQEKLPPRILRPTDICPLVLDFTLKQNIACQMLKTLRDLNEFTGGTLLKLWKEAMCSSEGRKTCKAILESMFAGKIYTLPELLEVLKPYPGTIDCIINT
ncbi:hypothetical protein NDU88_011608 [Pleurodeles waltl]|uniref:Uncharacterized protein n=1 Tax=Pleurodeles waltl TaxID=8319 RepID=A0AAV7S4R0_PLEWA|nr:hypothetical protein NDU88_011608 [Pleurodeles waltl]